MSEDNKQIKPVNVQGLIKKMQELCERNNVGGDVLLAACAQILAASKHITYGEGIEHMVAHLVACKDNHAEIVSVNSDMGAFLRLCTASGVTDVNLGDVIHFKFTDTKDSMHLAEKETVH